MYAWCIFSNLSHAAIDAASSGRCQYLTAALVFSLTPVLDSRIKYYLVYSQAPLFWGCRWVGESSMVLRSSGGVLFV